MARYAPSGAIACALGVVLLGNALLSPTVVPGARSLSELKFETQAALEAQDYRAAEQSAERRYRLASTFGPNSVAAREAAALLVRARVLNGNGMSPGTRELAERTLADDESALGPTALPLVNSLQALGDVYATSGDSDLAIRQYDRALRLVERSTASPIERATLQEALARALLQNGQYERAGSLFERLIPLLEAQEASHRALLANALVGEANVLLQRANYGGARPLLERAHSLVSNRGATPETARVLDSFGSLRWFEGDIADAEQYFRRAVAVAERVQGDDHPALIEYLLNLAAALSTQGHPADARALQERAQAIAARRLGVESLERVWILHDLASTLELQGDYVGARGLYEQVLDRLTSRLGPAHLHKATPLYNLALVYGHLGDYDVAKAYLEKAIAIWEQSLGPGHPYVARALDSLAEVFCEQGQFADARALYERALRIRTNRLNGDHREVAWTMANLARVLALTGDLRRANLLSISAVEKFKRSEPTARQYAQALLVRADVSLLSGQREAAVQHYHRALEDLQRVFGPVHPEIASGRAGLAIALARTGRSADALREALAAEKISREHLRLTSRSLAEHEALLYAGHRSRPLDVALSLVCRAPSCRARVRDVFDAVVRSRALVLDELEDRHRVAIGGHASDLGPWVEAVVKAKERLAHIVVAGPDSSMPGAYPSVLAAARTDEERAERDLAARSETYRRELNRAQSGLPEIQAALPPGSALVAFVRYSTDSTRDARRPDEPQDAYTAFVLRPNRLSVVPLGHASLVDTAVNRWRREAAGGGGGATSPEGEARYRRAGAALRRLVWDPVSPDLAGVRYAFLVPDALLNLVSFASLPVSGGYLIDGFPTLHYLSAERDLVTSFSDYTSEQSLLAVGGADFSGAGPGPGPGSNATAGTRGLPADEEMSSCPGLDRLTFAPLPGSALEAEEVGEQWRHDSAIRSARVLLGAQATEAVVKRDAAHHRVLHFATHGFFLGDACLPPSAGSRGVGGLSGRAAGVGRWQTDPLIQSGLALAGANDHTAASATEDGVLTAEEVSGLNLEGTEWAVLSACDTGVGTVATGEGVLGLRRAFQVAGVQTVIMSLWGADDEWSRRWMRALYADRLGSHLTTADAVRQASLAILNERRRAHLSSHPFFWAGFVAVGNWR